MQGWQVASLIVLLMLGSWKTADAQEQSAKTIEAIIAAEGVFEFHFDGAIYSLYKDHAFSLNPAGLSGRAIRGIWTRDDDGHWRISGWWTWNNGTSDPADYREVVLDIQYSEGEPTQMSGLGYGVERAYPASLRIVSEGRIDKAKFRERVAAVQVDLSSRFFFP